MYIKWVKTGARGYFVYLTNLKKQNPSRAANSRSTSQEIPRH